MELRVLTMRMREMDIFRVSDYSFEINYYLNGITDIGKIRKLESLP